MSGTKEVESFEVARCQSWIHTNARTQRFPAEHSIVGGFINVFVVGVSGLLL